MAAILAIMTYYPHHVTSSGHVANFKRKIFMDVLSKSRRRSLSFLGVKKAAFCASSKLGNKKSPS